MMFRSGLACIDTPGWKNGHGIDCKDYERSLCKNGRLKKGTTLGESYNYPEENCCACGKGYSWTKGIPNIPDRVFIFSSFLHVSCYVFKFL